MIKIEYVEEVLIKMGFMRNRENVEDKLEFMHLKEQLQLHQKAYQEGYRIESNLKISKQKSKDLNKSRLSDTNNLDAYLNRDSNIMSNVDENSGSENDDL